MIRRSLLNIDYANTGKLNKLALLTVEMAKVVNLYIQEIWNHNDFSSKVVKFKVETWLSSRLQQCLGKQALEIVKSQRKKKKKTMPIFKGTCFNLDSRFVDFLYNGNSFDIWVRLTSLGNKLSIKLPSKAHKHYNKFKNWNKSKSIRLKIRDNKFFLEVFFEKEEPEIKKTGKVVGVDCGYKKLLVSSENKTYDSGLEKIYEKITRKKQGSKAFQRSLVERDNKINESLNKLDLNGIKEIVCEDLKNVKAKTRQERKIRKKFNRKLQRWSYAKVLLKLSLLVEESGVLLTKVNPAFTSQKCSLCGVVEKNNRKGERYQCTCGNDIDADFNASINLSHMGVYSPHALY
jgi:IS605 OrfB family transposase